MKRNVGILIFDNAEVLDFTGPFEVFSVSSELHNHTLFNVFCVAKNEEGISAVNGLSINPHYSFENVPKIDILIISGGEGTKKQILDKDVLSWLEKTHKETELTLSICSGSRLLGVLGELDEKPYCTHHQVYENMKELVPTGKPQENKRFVRSGKIYTSGGISAGIDLSFHIVEQLYGKKVANDTARYMEYHRVDY